MKTSASYKENTAFSSVVMTRMKWRYRDRELLTPSSCLRLQVSNSLRRETCLEFLGWTQKVWTKIIHDHRYQFWIIEIRFTFTLDNKFYSHFASYTKKSRDLAISTTRHTHTYLSSKNKEIHDRVDSRVQLVWRLRVMGPCQYINFIHRRPRRGNLEDGCFSKRMRCVTRNYK